MIVKDIHHGGYISAPPALCSPNMDLLLCKCVYLFSLLVITVSSTQYTVLNLSTSPRKSSPRLTHGSIIHRTSFISSNYTSRKQRVLDLLHRDAQRVEALGKLVTQGQGRRKASISSLIDVPVYSGYPHGSAEYFVRVEIGTPAQSMYMILDPGSDVPWVQCLPCKSCYSQDDPLFNPKSSTTFARYRCTSQQCRSLERKACASDTACIYKVSYGDGSSTTGELVTDKFEGQRVAFGCGHDNRGLFRGAAGIIGLGGGKLSFVTQTTRAGSRKFSYCLVNKDDSQASSPLLLGDEAISPAVSYVYTTLYRNADVPTFYYTRLLDISVGGIRLQVPRSELELDSATGEGGLIIDAGTTVTYLPSSVYSKVKEAFRSGTSSYPVAEAFQILDTCFDFSGYSSVKVPTLTFHFEGADVNLSPSNYLWQVDDKGSYCLSLAQTEQPLSLYGNLQQQTMRLAFDLDHGRLGFSAKPQC